MLSVRNPASSSSTPAEVRLSVLEPSFGDAVFDHANFCVGYRIPAKLAKDSFFIRLSETDEIDSLYYLTSLGSIDQIEIKTPMALKEQVTGLRQHGDIQRLDSGGMLKLIEAAGSDYVLRNEAMLVAGFEMGLYAPDVPVSHAENRQAYFSQMKRLVSFMKGQLIPLYHGGDSTTQTSQAIKNLDTFLFRIQKTDFLQPSDVFDQSKRLLASLCYVFSLDEQKIHLDIFSYLCQQLGRCGPGTLISIVEAYLAIKADMSTDIPELIAGLREMLFNGLIMEHALARAVPSQKVMHLSAMMRPMANEFGFNLSTESNLTAQLQDQLVSHADVKIHPVNTREWLFSRFKEQFNRTAIIDVIRVNLYSALQRYTINCYDDLKDLMEQIDEGRSMLSPLFKMPAPHLSMTLLVALPSLTIRRDAWRNLRACVERYLILEGYIAYDRPVRAVLSVLIPTNTLVVSFGLQNGTRQELSELVAKTILRLGKNPDLGITRTGHKVLIRCADLKKSAYPVLLALSDIQEEYDLEENYLVRTLSILEKAGVLTHNEHRFLYERLNTSLHSLASTSTGIDPVYCVTDEDDSLALLEWSADSDPRDPVFLSYARSITGDCLLAWAIRNNADRFIQTLLDHPDFDELKDANPVLFDLARHEWSSLLVRWFETDKRSLLEPLISRMSLLESGVIDAIISDSAHPGLTAWLVQRYRGVSGPLVSTALSGLGLFRRQDSEDTQCLNAPGLHSRLRGG